MGVPLRPQPAAPRVLLDAHRPTVAEALEEHVAGQGTAQAEPVEAEVSAACPFGMGMRAALAGQPDAALHDLQRIQATVRLVEGEGLQHGAVAKPETGEP